MEEKMLIVNQVKSNRSEFMVWQVAISGEPFAQYCKTPLKALRFAFMLKKNRGVKISMEAIATLQAEISRQKETQPAITKTVHVEVEESWPEAKQFKKLKTQHPDALLLFRDKDFYTAHREDAQEMSEILGLAVTRVGKRDTCSFPHSALDTYLPKLVKAGKRIAICETSSEVA